MTSNNSELQWLKLISFDSFYDFILICTEIIDHMNNLLKSGT